MSVKERSRTASISVRLPADVYGTASLSANPGISAWYCPPLLRVNALLGFTG